MTIQKTKIIEIFIALLIIAFWVFMFRLGVENQFNIPAVESHDFYTFLEKKKPIIIDLRESDEILKQPLDYDRTIHLPFLFLESRLDQVAIPQDGPVLLVCSDGNRARLITTMLHKRGIETYFLRSGLWGVEREK
jgi:rhodanese-related sulfurtransferase